MPKDNIDYSNTIIYKIYCKDKNITDIYVGHTTNFTKRKCTHKSNCNNLTNEQLSKTKIYKIIRENGGWDNWDMVEIAKYNCKDVTEARIKEQIHYEELQSNLNSLQPYKHIIDYYCSICKLQCNDKNEYDIHISGKIHNFELVKINSKYTCEICKYYTDRKSNLDNHNKSDKHQNMKNKCKTITTLQNHYFCDICKNEYKTSSGLWKHRNKCKKNYNDEEELEKLVTANNEPTDKEMMMLLIKDNSEMKKMMMEVIKNGTHNTNNSHNKTFNLQFFLNEQCKDAMNITDFVNSIQLQLEDLEETGRLGYVDGISRVVIKNLDDMNTHKRPIHCSDSKREILYIKDNDQWIKDNENKDTMIKLIKQVANKNMRKIPEWIKAHPDCLDSDSKQNDKYLKIVSNSMSGSTEEEQKNNINKIISKVAREVIINK